MSWLILLFPSLIYVVLFRKPMGKIASGADAKKIKASAHWKKGQIQNIIDTPNFGPGYGFWKISYEFFFRRKSIKTPRQITTIPYQTSETKEEKLHLSWFGHSSYLIEVSRLKILMDPVLNGSAGPLRSMVKPFAFTNSIKVEDLGPIDYVIISHDHYDHLDYHSIKALSGSDCTFVCSLGVGSHLRYWGIEPNRILELHWGEKVELKNNIKIHSRTARHFSGRSLKRNQSFWSSFIMESAEGTVYLGADSGYGPHFSDIGKEFSKIDLAILECGQYNKMWPYIHMMPEETVQAAIDLGAKITMPVHWGKFSLAMHDWDEPIERFVAEATSRNVEFICPMIGQKIALHEKAMRSFWWREIN